MTYRRDVPERNEHRRYSLRVQGSLGGTIDLVCEWGRATVGMDRARSKIVFQDGSLELVMAVALHHIVKRERRGYRMVG